ncbi:MAG: purine-nucleoside phosphorylase, partial [Candidatus Omnitrophica bacterium]|nr:purine-nucleoside phosphorylase [Candidatus Omnitrophota bacterium]
MLAATSPLAQQLEEAVRAVTTRTRCRPSIGLIVGSGLGELTKALQVDATIDYADVPHMPLATAPGHEGTLVLGSLGAVRLAVLSGRLHHYE